MLEDFESTSSIGKGDDTITHAKDAAGANFSADIFGGEGADDINIANVSGIIVNGGVGQDTLEWTNGQATYTYSWGDSNEGSADIVSGAAAVTGSTFSITVLGDDLAIKTAETVTTSVDGTDYSLTFEGGVVYFGGTGISDVTAAVDFMDAALSDDQAAVFSFQTGTGEVASGSDFYFFAKGAGDETDLLVELDGAGVSGAGGLANDLTEANSFGNTEFTFTL